MNENSPEIRSILDEYQQKKLSRRQFLKKVGVAGVGATAAAALLASCGDDDEPVATTAAPTTTAAPATTAAPTTTAAPEEMGPTRGGTLREGYNRDVSKHDPITTNWYDPAFFAIYEAIVTVSPAGDFVPQYCTDFSVSDDGLEYRFTVEDRQSHSGGTITAADVAEFYRIQKFSFIASLASPISHYEVDGNQVVAKMNNAWVGTLGPLATGYWRIANINTWKEVGGYDDETGLAGESVVASVYGTEVVDATGPFKHTEWVPGSHSYVERWDDYPGSNVPYFENKGTAHLDAIRWTVITEAGQRATQLENGDIDTLLNPAHQDLARLQGNSDLTVYQHAEWSGYFMFMNRENFPEIFGDVETRRGLSHAVDREGMVQALLFGNGAATYGPFPTTDRYYDPAVEQHNNYDVAEANRLLDAAGWSMGSDGVRERDGVPLQFEFMVENESLQTAIATAAAAQFSQVGAQADVNVVDRAVWFERAGGPEVPAGLFMWLWPIPIDVLTLFCASYTIPVPNWSHANEPRIDQAIADWQAAGTEEAAAKAQSDFQIAWAETLPNMSFINQNSTFVKNNRVHGWSPHVWLLYPYYNDTWIEG